MPVPIIIDCDPGHDDALAIMLAAADPAVDLLAITTVAGNQTLEKTTLNARRVCTIAGITDVPIAAGCARPLLQPLAVAEDVHGASGLDGPRFPEPTVDVVPEHAVDLIHRILLEHPEPVTLVPTAPLTNIALLLTRHPDSAARIREIVLMGGSTERGNRTPAAEFNIMTDPEAADIVFRSGVPLTMCGLNVTHQALATPEIRARFDGLGTELGRVCSELLAFFASTYSRLFGMPHPRSTTPSPWPGSSIRRSSASRTRTSRSNCTAATRAGPRSWTSTATWTAPSTRASPCTWTPNGSGTAWSRPSRSSAPAARRSAGTRPRPARGGGVRPDGRAGIGPEGFRADPLT